MNNDTATDRLGQRAAQSARIPIGARLDHEDAAAPPRSLYVHVPFCFHKCHYCDFYSIVDTHNRMDPFVDRLTEELLAIAQRSGRPTLETVFIGGGTPTLLHARAFTRLLEAVRDAFPLARSHEWTVETNPETMTQDHARACVRTGVNRVSTGAQSFQPQHLATLERHHDPASVQRAIGTARDAGIDRVSLDLIYAIPGQTLDQWERDLDTALSLPIDHLSAYALTYEPNTPMTARLARGEFEPAPDELEVAMYELALEKTRTRGMERYEVSNHALPGSECRHNLAYWRGEDWLAAGPGAAGHLGGHRWTNTPRLDDYLAHSDAGFAPIRSHETPDARTILLDTIMMGIRTREGLSAERIGRLAAPLACAHALDERAARCVDRGWLTITADRWRLTDEGFHFADAVASDLMRVVPERP